MILLLVFGALVLLSIPSIQSSLAQSLTEKINKDFGVNLKIERLGINWKGVIDLREVLILDHHQDTLIQASKISTNILSLTDLEASRWAFGRLSLDEALLRIITYEDEPKHSLDHFLAQFPPSQEEDLDQEAFMLLIGRLALQDTRIEIKDYNPEFQSDLAFNHVFLSARDFRISGPDLGAKINSMGFESNFGLYVSKLSGDYYYDSASMGIANMNLITPQLSDLRGDLSLSYPQGMNDFSDKVYLELDLEEGSVIATSDINNWYNAFDQGGFIGLSGGLHGTLNNLSWSQAQLKYRQSSLTGEVKLKNMLNDAPFYLDIKGMRLTSRRDDLIEFMPQDLGPNLPASLKQLGKTSMIGALRLQGDVLTFNGTMGSALGQLKADFELGNLSRAEYAFYTASIETKGFQVGRLIGDKTIGGVTGVIQLKGRGFSPEQRNTQLNASFEGLQYLGYTYRNIEVTADLVAPFQKWSWSIDDEYLKSSGSLTSEENKDQIGLDLSAQVGFADLHTLGIVQRDSVAEFSGTFQAKALGPNFENLSGTLILANTFYQTQDRYYFFEDLALNLDNGPEQKKLTIDAPDVINGNLSGQFNWSDLPVLFQNAIGMNYINYVPKFVAPDQTVTYDFEIYHKIVDLFLPELQLGTNTRIKGLVTDKSDKFELDFSAPELLLMGNYLGGVNILIDNDHNLYRSAISVDSIFTGSRYFNDLRWVIGAPADTINASITLKGGKRKQDNYELNLFQTRDSLGNAVIGLNPSVLSLGDQTWQFNKDNQPQTHRLTIGDDFSLNLSPLVLSNKFETITLSGFRNDETSLSLEMDFDQVNIDHILPSIEDLKLAGMLNGRLQFKKIDENYFPSSNLMLSSFDVNDVPLGDLSVSITGNKDLTQYLINSTLNKDGKNRFKAIGSIDLDKDEPYLDMNLSLRDFDLKALSPLGRTVLSDISGLVDGRAKIQGLYNAPLVSGDLTLKRTKLRIPYLNINLAVEDKASIAISNGAFTIPPTRLTDLKYDTQATLGGLVTHENFRNWALDLNMTTDRFLALDTPAEESVLYYGTTFIDGGATIVGPADELVIDVTARTQKGTTFKIPISDVTTVGDDSFIRFISPEEKKARINGTTFVSDEIKGLTVNFDLDINDQAEVEILVDPANNSKFKGRGTGLMFIEINTLGKFKMWGEFVVIQGNYDFKYGGIVDKTIDVVPGGRISWNGAADQAQLDLTAKYRVEDVNPSALLDNPSLNSTVDVEVLLNLTGQIMQPELDFQLDFPNVSSAVRDELNVKLNEREQRQLQAIYLAATGAFQGDGGQNIVGTLTERVNKLVADLLADSDSKFKILPTIGTRQVDLNAQLEYNVGVQISTQISERVLINGKVAVPVGGANDSAVAGDLQVQWLVNDDGSLRMNFFNRQADLQFIGEDQIFEQGAGASYTVDFSTFQELFYKLFGKRIDREAF